MPRCRSCGAFLRRRADQFGARCSACGDPLFEEPRTPLQESASPEGNCSVHARNVATGTCERCGNYLCGVCRTRWHGTLICTACLERALETEEVSPVQVRRQWTHAVGALILSLTAWGMTIVGFILLMIGVGSRQGVGSLILGSLVLLGSGLPSVIGIGLGVSAVRDRGSHLILATAGVVLGGLHLGAIVGICTLSIWNAD